MRVLNMIEVAGKASSDSKLTKTGGNSRHDRVLDRGPENGDMCPNSDLISRGVGLEDPRVMGCQPLNDINELAREFTGGGESRGFNLHASSAFLGGKLVLHDVNEGLILGGFLRDAVFDRG